MTDVELIEVINDSDPILLHSLDYQESQFDKDGNWKDIWTSPSKDYWLRQVINEHGGTKALNDPKSKLRKRIDHYYKKRILPRWILDYAKQISGTDDKTGRNTIRFEFVYHLTEEFGGPYSAVALYYDDVYLGDPKEDKMFGDRMRVKKIYFSPLGLTPFDVQIGFYVTSALPEKIDDLNAIYVDIIRDRFSKIKIPEDRLGFNEDVEFAEQYGNMSRGKIYAELEESKPFVQDSQVYLERVYGKEEYDEVLRSLRKHGAKNNIDGFFDLIDSDKFLDGKYRKKIDALFKKKVLPHWILDYARSERIQSILGLNRSEIKAWFAYYFTDLFDNRVERVRLGHLVDIEAKYGKLTRVPIVYVPPVDITDVKETYNNLMEENLDKKLVDDIFTTRFSSVEDDYDLDLPVESYPNVDFSLQEKSGTVEAASSTLSFTFSPEWIDKITTDNRIINGKIMTLSEDGAELLYKLLLPIYEEIRYSSDPRNDLANIFDFFGNEYGWGYVIKNRGTFSSNGKMIPVDSVEHAMQLFASGILELAKHSAVDSKNKMIKPIDIIKVITYEDDFRRVISDFSDQAAEIFEIMDYGNNKYTSEKERTKEVERLILEDDTEREEIPRELKYEWLVFGVAYTDYKAWKDYANSQGARLTVFATDNHNNAIPTDEIIIGNFNDINDLRDIEDQYYDRIIFARATVKFLRWFGIHLKIISEKLTGEEGLYIPNEIPSTRMAERLNFQEVLEEVGKNRSRTMIKGETKLPPSDFMSYSEGKKPKVPTSSLFVGGNRVVVVVNEQDKKLRGNEKTREEYNEFYYNENADLLELFFKEVELLDNTDYPAPSEYNISGQFWKCNTTIRRPYTPFEEKILRMNEAIRNRSEQRKSPEKPEAASSYIVKPEENWLVFGVGEDDFQDWNDYANSQGARLTVFNTQNEGIPEDQFVKGDFNYLPSLNELPDRYYDRILFSRSTAKFTEWFGIHVAVLSMKLKKDGELFISESNAGASLYGTFGFETVLEQVEKARLTATQTTKLGADYDDETNVATLYSRNKTVPTPVKSVFTGAFRIELEPSRSKNKRAQEVVEKGIKESEEFYYEQNLELFNIIFDDVERSNGEDYPEPEFDQNEIDFFWKLGGVKRDVYTPAEKRILKLNDVDIGVKENKSRSKSQEKSMSAQAASSTLPQEKWLLIEPTVQELLYAPGNVDIWVIGSKNLGRGNFIRFDGDFIPVYSELKERFDKYNVFDRIFVGADYAGTMKLRVVDVVNIARMLRFDRNYKDSSSKTPYHLYIPNVGSNQRVKNMKSLRKMLAEEYKGYEGKGKSKAFSTERFFDDGQAPLLIGGFAPIPAGETKDNFEIYSFYNEQNENLFRFFAQGVEMKSTHEKKYPLTNLNKEGIPKFTLYWDICGRKILGDGEGAYKIDLPKKSEKVASPAASSPKEVSRFEQFVGSKKRVLLIEPNKNEVRSVSKEADLWVFGSKDFGKGKFIPFDRDFTTLYEPLQKEYGESTEVLDRIFIGIDYAKTMELRGEDIYHLLRTIRFITPGIASYQHLYIPNVHMKRTVRTLRQLKKWLSKKYDGYKDDGESKDQYDLQFFRSGERSGFYRGSQAPVLVGGFAPALNKDLGDDTKEKWAIIGFYFTQNNNLFNFLSDGHALLLETKRGNLYPLRTGENIEEYWEISGMKQ